MSELSPAPPARPVPWYLTRRGVWLGLLVAGPLALPLLWWSPRYGRVFKTALTAAVLFATYLSIHYTGILITRIESRMTEIQELLRAV